MKVTDVLTTLRKRETMPTMTDELPPMTSPLDPDDFDKPASRGFVRYELAVTRGELREDIAATKLELKQDIANVRAELKQDIANVRAELKQDIADLRLELADVRRELKQDIADLRNEMMERFNKLDRSLWWKLSVAVGAASALSELLSRM
jgi:gamma-glutamyl:cysteine ligase YbdK (ATP-grasp superfamily)